VPCVACPTAAPVTAKHTHAHTATAYPCILAVPRTAVSWRRDAVGDGSAVRPVGVTVGGARRKRTAGTSTGHRSTPIHVVGTGGRPQVSCAYAPRIDHSEDPRRACIPAPRTHRRNCKTHTSGQRVCRRGRTGPQPHLHTAPSGMPTYTRRGTGREGARREGTHHPRSRGHVRSRHPPPFLTWHTRTHAEQHTQAHTTPHPLAYTHQPAQGDNGAHAQAHRHTAQQRRPGKHTGTPTHICAPHNPHNLRTQVRGPCRETPTRHTGQRTVVATSAAFLHGGAQHVHTRRLVTYTRTHPRNVNTTGEAPRESSRRTRGLHRAKGPHREPTGDQTPRAPTHTIHSCSTPCANKGNSTTAAATPPNHTPQQSMSVPGQEGTERLVLHKPACPLFHAHGESSGG